MTERKQKSEQKSRRPIVLPYVEGTSETVSRVMKKHQVPVGLESTVQHSTGCPISSAAEAKSSVSAPVNPMPPLCILVYRRVPSSAQSGSSNMQRMSTSFLAGCGTTCLLMICKASSTADQTMSQKLCQPWNTAPPTSVPGVLPSACSLMPRKPRFCGSAQQQTCARFRQMSAAFVSALQWSRQRPSSAISA